MSPFLFSVDAKKKQTYDTCEGTKNKKNTEIKLYANQVMLLVIRLTMKNNITKLLQHYSSQWLVAGRY